MAGLPCGGEVPHQQVGDGRGLLDRDQVGGAGDDGETGVRDAGDQGAGLGGAGDLVVGADQDQGRDADLPELATHVERGECFAGGDVAAGVGGPHHLHGPLGDRGLGGGEPSREPTLRRAARDGVHPVRTDDHTTLAELVRRPEARRGGDQREGGEAFGVAQRQFDADGTAEGTARVAEALHAESVECGQQTRGELGDGTPRVGGGAAVPRQVEAEDPPLLRQLGHLPVPHVPCGTQ